jgi:chorismate-pyruvate lyase
VYTRWVVLLAGEKVVEFAGINIDLSSLPAAMVPRVIEGKVPLGSLLLEHHVEQVISPRMFFETRSDALLETLFSLDLGTRCSLFGRRNRICNAAGALICETVEILPPEPERPNTALN